MAHFAERPLGEVCSIKPKKSEARSRLVDSDEVSFVPMEYLGVGVKHLLPHGTRKLGEVAGSYTYFADGDVLLAKITPCFENGKLGIARGLTNGVGFGSSEYVVMRPTPELDAEFLYYYLTRPAFLEEGARIMTGAVGHKRITKEFVESYPIPLPPLAEQRRIVAILDEAFKSLATARANAEKNLQNARELAEALGEICFAEHVDAAFEPRELASLCEFIVDCEHKTAPTEEHGYPSIRTPNIGKGRLILDNVNRVSEATYIAWTRRAVPRPGDLILAREAPAGNVAVIPEGVNVCLGQRTVLIRPNREIFEPEYLAHLLLQRSSQRRLLAHSRGATVQHINLKDIRAFMIEAVPSLDTQRQVVEKLAEIERACQALEAAQRHKLVALAELKNSLLHQAFSGRLTSASPISPAGIPVLETTSPEFSATIIALGYERHRRRQRENTCGRVKGQKVLHLAEALAKLDLGRRPIKDAAGPNDFAHMLKAEAWAKRNDFFEMVPREGGGYEFKPLSGYSVLMARVSNVLGESRERIEAAIDLVVPLDTRATEVLATVYAAWNNLLMDGVAVSDETIVRAARDDWHPDKLAIPASKFREAIAFIRSKGLEPDGCGKYVGGQQQLGI